MTEKYESRQQQIHKPAETVYAVLSDFNNFTPIVADKVEGWTVAGDECSFRVKGISVSLRMVEKIPGRLVKIEASDSSPFGFTLWVQLKEVSGIGSDSNIGDPAPAEGTSCGCASDTRMRLVLHAEMNMMIKMMIGGKIQPALDGIAEHIARTFNAL